MVSEDGEIKSIKFNDYVSFLNGHSLEKAIVRGAKSENSALFKGFATKYEWNRIVEMMDCISPLSLS